MDGRAPSFASASYVELDMAKKEESLLESPLIRQLAAKHSKSSAQIVLRWAVQVLTCVDT